MGAIRTIFCKKCQKVIKVGTVMLAPPSLIKAWKEEDYRFLGLVGSPDSMGRYPLYIPQSLELGAPHPCFDRHPQELETQRTRVEHLVEETSCGYCTGYMPGEG